LRHGVVLQILNYKKTLYCSRAADRTKCFAGVQTMDLYSV